MEFFGRLASFPPSDLLQWARNERRTGALVLRRSTREKRVYFSRGDVVACHSDDPAEFYGQHLLLSGHLNKLQLLEALAHCSETGKRLGAALLDLGTLPRDVVRETLSAQIEDSVLDLFLWRRGIFYFEDEMPPEEDLLPEPIDAMGLALEGARWQDEYARIRKVLINDDVVLEKGAAWSTDELSPLEQRVANGVDGRRTLADLYRGIRGSYFRFLEAAMALCKRSVLDLHRVPEEGQASSATRELSIYDLLLEQASEEQAFAHPQGVKVPLEALEGLVPLWVGDLPDSSDPRGELHRHCDGSTRLGEILRADRARESELLFVELGRGHLALLPAPLDELETRAEEAGTPEERRWWRRFL